MKKVWIALVAVIVISTISLVLVGRVYYIASSQLNAAQENINSVSNNVSASGSNSSIETIRNYMDLTQQSIDGLRSNLQSIENMLSFENKINAEKAFQYASAETEVELKDAYYLNALAHDPANETYFISYLNFLQSINADYSYYYSLYMLLAESLYSVGAEYVEAVNSFLEIVNEKLVDFDNLSTEESLIPVWDALYSDFITFSSDGEMDYQLFADTVESMSSIYSLFKTPSEEINKEKDYINYVQSMVDIYIVSKNTYAAIIVLPYTEFDILYPSVCNVINTSLTEFVSRDSSLDGAYGRYFAECQSSLIDMQISLDKIYDSLLCQEFNRKYNNILNNIETMPLRLRVAKLNEIQSIISPLFAIGTSAQAMNICNWYSKQLENAQKENFQNYQVWAASMLGAIDERVSAAKKKDKLDALFASGYFNIDSTLLIPQLKTWYDSLYTVDIKEESTLAFDDLLKKYPIECVTLEDVQ